MLAFIIINRLFLFLYILKNKMKKNIVYRPDFRLLDFGGWFEDELGGLVAADDVSLLSLLSLLDECWSIDIDGRRFLELLAVFVFDLVELVSNLDLFTEFEFEFDVSGVDMLELLLIDEVSIASSFN